MLTHEAYLDALQSLRSTTAEWRAVVAGLLVLRLIDAWLDEDGHLVTRDVGAMQAVQEALAGVHERHITLPILRELAEITTQYEQAIVSRVAAPLLAYGESLHRMNQWWLALDVFASLLSHAQAIHDEVTSIRAASRLGFILRELGRFDAAQDAYTLALNGASRLGRSDLYYTALGGFAGTLATRGRFQESEDLFKTIIQNTRILGLTETYARSLHGLASLAMQREDYATALHMGQLALLHTSAALDRELLHANNGAALVGLGDHTRAKEILLAQLDGTHFDATRQRTLANLLEIAAKEANKTDFDKYRQALAGTIVLPDIQAHYHHFVAKGYYVFNTPVAAAREWKTALEIAEANNLSPVSELIQSEMAAMIGCVPMV